jgi:hypothetical protein
MGAHEFELRADEMKPFIDGGIAAGGCAASSRR